MPRYKVLRDCVGFKNGYWKEGQIVDLGDEEKPPRHFQLIGGAQLEVAKAPEPAAPVTMSQINAASAADKPNTGMAYVSTTPAKSPAESKSKPAKSGKK